MTYALPLLVVAAGVCALDVEPAKLATADASPLDPGTIELSTGATWTAADRALDTHGHAADRGGQLTEAGLGLGITCGLADGLDAGIALGWTRVTDDASDPGEGRGLTDIELAAKWRVLQYDGDGRCAAVALLPLLTAPMDHGQDHDMEIPTASRCWTLGLGMAASGSIGRLALNADVGYAQALGSAGEREGYLGTLRADTALGVQVSESVQPEIDLSWSRDRVEDGAAPWSLAMTAGAQFGLSLGRLGLGVQRVLDGGGVDETTSLIADLAIAFE